MTTLPVTVVVTNADGIEATASTTIEVATSTDTQAPVPPADIGLNVEEI